MFDDMLIDNFIRPHFTVLLRESASTHTSVLTLPSMVIMGVRFADELNRYFRDSRQRYHHDYSQYRNAKARLLRRSPTPPAERSAP